MLKSRGLIITDDAWAEKILEDISYFRIVAYLRPMELDHTTHQFKPGATLEKAYQLYDFDKKLRLLVFNYWCPLKIFGDFWDFYFLGQPIYWTHK